MIESKRYINLISRRDPYFMIKAIKPLDLASIKILFLPTRCQVFQKTENFVSV